MALEVKIYDPYVTGFVVTLATGGKLLKRRNLSYSVGNSIDERSHVIRYGEELWMIARKYYGNARYWWVIADVNEIINPIDLTPGDELIIPPIDLIKTIL